MTTIDHNLLGDESRLPLGTVWLIPCAAHGLQHRMEVIDDPEFPGHGKRWYCIDPEPDKERLDNV